MTALFQQLPSVDKFLKTPEGEMLLTKFGHSAVVRELRQLLFEGREFIKQHQNLPHFAFIFHQKLMMNDISIGLVSRTFF